MRREPPIYFTTSPPRAFEGIDRSVATSKLLGAGLRVPPSMRAAFDELEAQERERNRRALRTPDEIRRDDLVESMAYAYGFSRAEAQAALAQLEYVGVQEFGTKTSKPLTLATVRRAARELIRRSNPAARAFPRARRRQLQ